MAVIACGSCGKKFQVGPKAFGQTIPCPNCRSAIFVPTEDLAGDLDLGGGAPSAPVSAPAPQPYQPTGPTPQGYPAQGYPAAPGPAQPALGYGPPVGNAPYSNAPYGSPLEASNNLGDMAAPLGGLPSPGQTKFKPIVPPPEWHANPMLWAAVAVPFVAIFLLIVLLSGRKNRDGNAAGAGTKPPAVVVNRATPPVGTNAPVGTSAPAGTGAPATSPSAPAPAGAPAPAPVAPASGVNSDDGSHWNATVDPSTATWPPTPATSVPVHFHADSEPTLAPNSLPFAALHDPLDPTRIAVTDVFTGDERGAWTGFPARRGVGALDAGASTFAYFDVNEGVCELIVAEPGRDALVRTPILWPSQAKVPPVFMAFSGRDLILVPAGLGEIERWTGGATAWTRTAVYPGRWPRRSSGYAISPGGKYLAMFNEARHLVVIDLTNGEEAALLVEASFPSCHAMAFSLDGTHLGALVGTDKLAVWNFATGRRVGLIQTPTPLIGSPRPGDPAGSSSTLQPLVDKGWLVDRRYAVSGGGQATIWERHEPVGEKFGAVVNGRAWVSVIDETVSLGSVSDVKVRTLSKTNADPLPWVAPSKPPAPATPE